VKYAQVRYLVSSFCESGIQWLFSRDNWPASAGTTICSNRIAAWAMTKHFNVKIGINPLSWSNDDLPSLGGDAAGSRADRRQGEALSSEQVSA
jgi:hypothetical protein